MHLFSHALSQVKSISIANKQLLVLIFFLFHDFKK